MIARMVRKTADIRFAVVAFPSRDECKYDFRTQTTQAHVVTRRDGHQQEVKCCNFNTRYLCSHVISLKKNRTKLIPWIARDALLLSIRLSETSFSRSLKSNLHVPLVNY